MTYKSLLKNQVLTTDILTILIASYQAGVIDGDVIITFLENQIRKIEEEQLKAKSQKSKEDLNITRIYETLKKDYRKFLKNETYKLKQKEITSI